MQQIKNPPAWRGGAEPWVSTTFFVGKFGQETRKLRLFTSKMNFQTVPLTVWAVKQVQDISFAFILYTLVERVELEKRLLHAYAKTMGAPSWHLQSCPNKRSVQLFALLAQTRYDVFGYHSCFVQIMNVEATQNAYMFPCVCAPPFPSHVAGNMF